MAAAYIVVAANAIAADCEILVSREGKCVEKWSASAQGGRGGWTKQSVFIEGTETGVQPTGLAASADGVVYVGDAANGGSIRMYGLDGSPRGVLTATGYRPDQMCVSSDGKWLYVSTLTTADRKNGVWRYARANGKGGKFIDCGPGWQPRSVKFGADGNLYAGCRGDNAVYVFDVSGETSVLKGKVGVMQCTGAFELTRPNGTSLVVPGVKTETVDLVKGVTSFSCMNTPFENTIGSCQVAEHVYAADFHSGVVRFVAWNSSDGCSDVASGVYGACALLNLTETMNGEASRACGRYLAGQKNLGKPLVYATPKMPEGMDFARMGFNNPDATIFLKAGFGVDSLRVLDYDGDGQLDIVVTCGWDDWPWAATYLYRNPTQKGQADADPVFPKHQRFDPTTLPPPLPPCTFADGTAIGDVHYTAGKTGDFWKGRTSQGGVRQLKDLDGDGMDDLVIPAYDRNMDAWQDCYDARGNWRDIQMRGFVYWCKGLGGGKYGDARMLYMENNLPVEVYGRVCTLIEDYDGDGDYDLILFDYMDTIMFVENVGSKTEPLYTSGRFLRAPDGSRLHGDLCLPCAISADWDRDGKADIMFGEEDSRVAWCRNTGKFVDGMPVFEKPRYFRQKADELHFGVLSCPWTYDWDGDGDFDILCGNSHGQIAFIENLSGRGVEKPKWAAPVYLTEPDGKIIWPTAGKNGSIQGPCESKWGYATISVADWDGDGLPDIMGNNTMGEVKLWRNIGTRMKPKLDYAHGVEVEWNGEQPELAWGWKKPKLQKNPKELLAQWRTTPVMTDWNGDGLTDLVMLDHEGYLCLYERAKSADGKRMLTAPRRAFFGADGKPMLARCGFNRGIGCGRRKFTVCDWDGDGKTDIVMNGGPNAEVWLQTEAKEGNWHFRSAGPVARLNLSTHDPQPAVCDFNGDGIPDLVFGAMDGYIYYYRNPRTK